MSWFTWLAVSTHAREYEEIVKAHELLKSEFSNAKLIIAPRHPKKFSQFKALFSDDPSVSFNEQLGEMEPYFKLADAVFVGGTFNPKIGGHNVLEPIGYKKPTLVGPFTDKINELIGLGTGIVQVQNGQELGLQLIELSRDIQRCSQIGEACYVSYLQAGQGILESYVRTISQVIDERLRIVHPTNLIHCP